MRLLVLAGCMQSLVLHPSTDWQTGGLYSLHGKPAALVVKFCQQAKIVSCLEHDANMKCMPVCSLESNF